MFSLTNLGNSLRAVASGLQIPVMAILLILIALTVFYGGYAHRRGVDRAASVQGKGTVSYGEIKRQAGAC